ncbi:hypothetical protein [Legionella sp. WA2022007384]
MNWGRAQYQALLNLKKHASQMISSLEQLKGVTEGQQINSMYSLIETALEEAISETHFDASKHFNLLNNQFSLLKDEIEEYKNLEKCFSGCNLLGNSIVTSVAALGVVLFGTAVATGPLGVALLGLGMAIVSALICSTAAYSVYVDARFIGDKQLKELETGIKFLNIYPNVEGVFEEEQLSNTPCCI